MLVVRLLYQGKGLDEDRGMPVKVRGGEKPNGIAMEVITADHNDFNIECLTIPLI